MAAREAPRGFGANVDGASLESLKQIAKLLDRISAGEITLGGGGSDIAPLMQDWSAGGPPFGERTVGTHYFDWHHNRS